MAKREKKSAVADDAVVSVKPNVYYRLNADGEFMEAE